MQRLETNLKMSCNTMLLFGLLVLGAILRILSCFWGYPYQLHPDEWTIVNTTIDMIARHSYFANTYIWPAHFNIKCCAILFQIFSYIKYHVSAEIAFQFHSIEFHIIARIYTAFFGVLTIGLAYKTVEKIMPQSKIIAAGLVTFFPIFVRNSAYATTDVVLAFFVLLIAYFSILFLEMQSVKYLTLMCVATGVGIAIKFTCAIACIWIAIVVCIDCIKKKKYMDIVKAGIFSVIIVLTVFFLLAPNILINISQTIGALRNESRSTHLGADGLGFFGNFKYYLITFLNAAGYEALICILAGLLFCIKNRNMCMLSMGLGLLFWLCTSVLALHWERWGMPIYIFYVILSAIGISYLYGLTKRKWYKSIIFVFGFIIIFNSLVSGLLLVQSSLTPEARVDAIKFCEENGITKENTLYDGYTPFRLTGYGTIKVSFDEQGNVQTPPEIQYVIISGATYNRYYAEPERYSAQVDMYDNVQNHLQLIYSEGGNYYDHSNIGIINIVQAVKGLVSHNSSTVGGAVIKIYRVSNSGM